MTTHGRPGRTHDVKAHDGDVHRRRAGGPPPGTDTIEVVNPADEQVIATVPAGAAEDVDAAVRAARAALPGWAATPPAERAARLAALRDALVARTDEIAETVTAELGSPAGVLAGRCTPACRSRSAARTPNWPPRTPSRRRSATPPCCTSRSASSARSRPGTTRCTRSSPRSPRRSPRAARSCSSPPRTPRWSPSSSPRPSHEAGLPAGVFNLVTGLGPVAGQALAEHDGRRPGLLHRLHRRRPADRRRRGRRGQAGRPGAGRQVRQRHPARAPTWPRPSTVGVANVMANSGQTCSAWTRMLVHTRPVRRGRGARAPAAAAKYVPGERRRPASSTPSSATGCAATSSRASPRARGSSRAAPRPRGDDGLLRHARPSSPTSPRR